MSGAAFVDARVFMDAAEKSLFHKKPCLPILQHIELKAMVACRNTEILKESVYPYGLIGLVQKGFPRCNEILKFSLPRKRSSQSCLSGLKTAFDRMNRINGKPFSASSAPRRENPIQRISRVLTRLRRRGVSLAPNAGLRVMTERILHLIVHCARGIDQFVPSKSSVFYSQEFVARLQISAFQPQLQAGSLCYNN